MLGIVCHCYSKRRAEEAGRRKEAEEAGRRKEDHKEGGSLARRGLAARLGPAAKVNCRVSKLRSGCKRELGRRHP